MKFQVKAADLNDALTIVSIVPPRALTPQGGAGYLFVVRENTCYVYSRDSLRVARADFPVTNVEGEGAFIYPSAYVEGFRFLQDEVLTIEAVSEADVHTVRYTSGSGATAERTSYDPRLMAGCDKEVEAATDARDFPVALLREAIAMSKPFLAKPQNSTTDEQYKTLQIFDASNEAWSKGDGTLFAADGTQAFYFYCDAFKGKNLGIHGQHLPFVTAFLSKCDESVTFKTGQNMTFATDSRGRILGWTHHTKSHQKYAYYALKNDKHVFDVPVRAMVNALKYTGTELDAQRDKIRLNYTAATNELAFTVVEGNAKAKSFPVPVVAKEGSEAKDFSFAINLYHLLELMAGAKGDRLELRVAILPADERRPKDQAMFRTIDEFLLDNDGKVVGGSGVEVQPENTSRCRVTRFMPSKE